MNIPRKARVVAAVGCALLWIIFLLATTVHAAEPPANASYNLTTSPVFTTLTTKPGQAVKTQIKVQNNASKAVDLRVSLMKFKAYGQDGRAQLLTPKADDPSVAWASFSRPVVSAQPGVWNTIDMTIKPDRTAGFGYYYAVVFSPVTTTKVVNGNAVTGSSAVLVLLDVQVPGEKRQMTVTNFKTEQGIQEFLPVRFTTTVKNTGDIHGAPSGDIYITRNHKDNLAILPVNQEQGNILPGSSRSFTTAWNDGFPAHVVKRIDGQVVNDRNGKPVTTLSWEASKLNALRFGHYYAHLLLVYNNGSHDIPLEAETSFWVIPWRPLLVAVILLALIIVGLIVLLKRGFGLGRRMTRRSNKSHSDGTTHEGSKKL